MSIQSNLPRPPLALARSIRAATLRRHVAGRGAPVFSAPSPDPTPLRGRVSRPVGGPCCRSRSRPQPASLTLLAAAKHTQHRHALCRPWGPGASSSAWWNLHVPWRRAGYEAAKTPFSTGGLAPRRRGSESPEPRASAGLEGDERRGCNRRALRWALRLTRVNPTRSGPSHRPAGFSSRLPLCTS